MLRGGAVIAAGAGAGVVSRQSHRRTEPVDLLLCGPVRVERDLSYVDQITCSTVVALDGERSAKTSRTIHETLVGNLSFPLRLLGGGGLS